MIQRLWTTRFWFLFLSILIIIIPSFLSNKFLFFFVILGLLPFFFFFYFLGILRFPAFFKISEALPLSLFIICLHLNLLLFKNFFFIYYYKIPKFLFIRYLKFRYILIVYFNISHSLIKRIKNVKKHEEILTIK